MQSKVSKNNFHSSLLSIQKDWLQALEKIIFTKQVFERFAADPDNSLPARLGKTKLTALRQILLSYPGDSPSQPPENCVVLDPGAPETVLILQQLQTTHPDVEIVACEKRLPKIKQDIPESVLYGFRKLSTAKYSSAFFSPGALQDARAC